MTTERQIDPGHQEIRALLRVVGPLLAVIGGLCMIVAFIDFFSAASSAHRSFPGPGMPSSFPSSGRPRAPALFWLFFVGGPLLFAGLALSSYGFMGAVARYQAAEVAPVAKDAINYMADGTKESVRTVARAAGAGLAEGMGARPGAVVVRCHKCNRDNPADAKFCNACGAALSKTRPCPECGELNDPDAKFCDACGRGFEG